MFRVLWLSLLLAAACCTLAACAQAPVASSTPTRRPAASPTSAASPTAAPSPAASPTARIPASAASPTAATTPLTPGDVPPEASAAVEEATAAVAQQLGLPASQVTVVSVQMVEWSDTSLGCPEPGMAYAEVITPGYLIRLAAGGQLFEYHADRQGNVITCPNPQPPALVAK